MKIQYLVDINKTVKSKKLIASNMYLHKNKVSEKINQMMSWKTTEENKWQTKRKTKERRKAVKIKPEISNKNKIILIAT